MKAIMVMYDSLNRHLLPPYGCQWVHAPNFKRLAQKCVTFDNCYVGSMPCMPARRELHTGRYNFLHRSWGPMEPFDDSMPQILKESGVYTHLVSDHQHYWEDGGCTYHTRYSSWEISRGQEGDPWKGQIKDPDIPKHLGQFWRQDTVNRSRMDTENKQPQAKTFAKGMEFLETNKDEDNWFLQIETFDPHEPFFTPKNYKDLYSHEYSGPHFDWPEYKPVTEKNDEIEHIRYENAALLSMCDHYLGLVLDFMDKHDMWQDTMLIVSTDHGFLLGEHDWWAKCVMPFYQEIAHIPLFVWDPRFPETAGKRRSALVQMIDLPATLLEFFGASLPHDMQGIALKSVIEKDRKIRNAALFGMHGGHVNITDGEYVYMRAPEHENNTPLYNYTLMPTHMRGMFSVEELRRAVLSAPFGFSKGCPLIKVPTDTKLGVNNVELFKDGSMLFDVLSDPAQSNPIENKAEEMRMIKLLTEQMEKNEAPPEQYIRLGLKN